MTDLSIDLKASIADLQTRHGALLTAVQAYRTGSAGASKAELTAAIASLDARLATEESTLLGLAGRGVQPSLSLDFMSGMYLMGENRPSKGYAFSDLITFSRGSTATYFNSAGSLVTAAIDTPRFDYDPITKALRGLLIEEARTNVCLRSSDFTGATWYRRGSCAVDTPSVAAPDGSLKGALVTGLAYGQNDIYVQVGGMLADQLCTPSIFISKVSPTGTLRFNNPIGGTGVGSWEIDLSKLSTGWERITRNHPAVTVLVEFKASTGGLAGIQLLGTTGAPLSVNVFGAQLETGTFESSYIPTPSTFVSRASTATYLDSSGVIQTAASGVARGNAYGYTAAGALRAIGLQLENASTNLAIQSADLNLWGKNTVTAAISATKAPDNVDFMRTLTSTSTLSSIVRPVTITGIHTFSFYVKAGSVSTCALRFFDSAGEGARATFDLTAGTVVNSAGSVLVSSSIQPVGGGIYRVTLTADYTTRNNAGLAVYLYVTNSNGATSGDSILAWGGQLEAGQVATSYIPTVASQVTRASDISSSVQVTRAADTAGVNALTPWHNRLQGTLTTEAKCLANSGAPHVASLRTANNFSYEGYRIYYEAVSNRFRSAFRDFNGPDYTANSASGSGLVEKLALSYDINSTMTLCGSGSAINTSIAGQDPPNVTWLSIGRGPDNLALNGHVRRIRYYPKKLTNAQLMTLTA